MTDGDKRRKVIFDRYADNLALMVSSGVLSTKPKYARTYICPICTNHYSEDDLKQDSANPLTLEDVPPKSLGGKANILTCRNCNNHCGKEIDFHLTERMREMDNGSFLPNTEFYAKFTIGDQIVQGKVIVDENGKMQAYHAKKNNHPEKLETYISSVIPNDIIHIDLKETRVNPLNLQYAILKIGYLLTFAKFGYPFILDKTYDKIREQLLNPRKEIHTTDFWFHAPYPKEYHGVPFITEKGMEAIMPLFELDTGISERTFATIVPLPGSTVERTFGAIKERFKGEKEFQMQMDAMRPRRDYLTDVDEIQKILNWMSEKIKQV